ncbi:MAG: hypothetical protein ACJ8D5_03240 [Sphingomicrobium sp.]
MRKVLVFAAAALAASPAYATGGLVCRTAGPRPVEISVGFGHVAGAPLIATGTRLRDNGRNIPVSAPQWWLDNSELRLLLTDPSAMRRELVLKAQRNGLVYDGNIWRSGQRRWVRCREG